MKWIPTARSPGPRSRNIQWAPTAHIGLIAVYHLMGNCCLRPYRIAATEEIYELLPPGYYNFGFYRLAEAKEAVEGFIIENPDLFERREE